MAFIDYQSAELVVLSFVLLQKLCLGREFIDLLILLTLHFLWRCSKCPPVSGPALGPGQVTQCVLTSFYLTAHRDPASWLKI